MCHTAFVPLPHTKKNLASICFWHSPNMIISLISNIIAVSRKKKKFFVQYCLLILEIGAYIRTQDTWGFHRFCIVITALIFLNFYFSAVSLLAINITITCAHKMDGYIHTYNRWIHTLCIYSYICIYRWRKMFWLFIFIYI